MKELRGFELTGTNIPRTCPWQRSDNTRNSIDAELNVFEIRIFSGSVHTDPVINNFPGGNSLEETPDPIPNSAVKLKDANGTAGATPWESQSPPGL